MSISYTRRDVVLGSIATVLLPIALPVSATSFPPLPDWTPSFGQPRNLILKRFRYYLDNKQDFAIFEHGTCVLLENGLSDQDGTMIAKEILSNIYNAHPDMKPIEMDDGNLLVGYNYPAYNVVLRDVARANWVEIEAQHKNGLVRDEVLMTPLGANQFDDVGKQALLGRCYMFMDAQAPNLVQIARRGE